jgi:hypothetical protein
MFKQEWIPKWVYPNTIVEPGERVTVAGLTFTVIDLGAGGDSDANSIWSLENDSQAAFVGDFLYRENHAYMMDGASSVGSQISRDSRSSLRGTPPSTSGTVPLPIIRWFKSSSGTSKLRVSRCSRQLPAARY